MGYDVEILHDLVGGGALDAPDIPWFSLNFLLFYYPGGRTHNSCAVKGSPPLRAPADISAQRKFVIWLANKVRETNLFSSFGYGENS